MNSQLSLSNELRKLIESKLEQTLIGIENTFSQILKKQDIKPIELKLPNDNGIYDPMMELHICKYI